MNIHLKKITSLAFKFIFILWIFSICNLQAAEKPQFTIGFFNPHTNNNSTFWDLVDSGMQAACNDLGIKLKIYRSNYLAQVRELTQAAKNKEIDAAIFKPLNHNGLKLLNITEQYQIPSILINVGLATENLKKAGSEPRKIYKSWIGQILPNDENVGYILAEGLVKIARQKKIADQDGKIHLVGISGIKGDGSAIARKKGLERFFEQPENTDVILHQIVHADWMKENAKVKFLGLKKRYPETSVIWSANDNMALGIIEGINELGLKANKDIIIAGIDWVPEAIDAIEAKQLSFSLGGHFMEGAWAVILLYDYFHGIDFAESEGIKLYSAYTSLDSHNVKQYKHWFSDNDWEKIDFSHFSKKLNPQLKKYSFNMQAIFEQLQSQEKKLKILP